MHKSRRDVPNSAVIASGVPSKRAKPSAAIQQNKPSRSDFKKKDILMLRNLFNWIATLSLALRSARLLAMTVPSALFFLFSSLPLFAAPLTIGLRADVTSIDPHYHVSGPNLAVANHIYEPLVKQNDKQESVPGLATAWRKINDTTWELDLRPNVTFHQGEKFTAKDVVASLMRIKKGVGPINAFITYVKHIDRAEIIDPLKVRIITTKPYPLLIWDLANLLIVPESKAHLQSEDFNSKSYGTGPYQFVSWTPQDHIKLKANPSYWGGKEPWDDVTFKPIPNEITRYNGLKSGDLDVIESAPINLLENIKKDPKFSLIAKIPTRLMYLALDAARAETPYIKGVNPLKDKRVRQAISFAINRPQLIQNFLGGYALPAGQLVPPESIGYLDGLKADEYNPTKAKELLREAGFENGFALTLHGTQDRYINDAKVTQALTMMLSQIHITTRPEILPSSLFFTRALNSEFTLSLAGWPAGREALSPLQALLYTYEPKKGTGLFNRGRYSSAALDALIDKALMTMDDAARCKMVEQANQMAVEDYAIIPLYFSMNNWASRSNLTYAPRMDEYTLAMNVRGR